MVTRGRAFLAGATTPSGAAALGTFAVFFAWVLVLLCVLRPSVLRSLDEGWFILHPRDDYGRLTHAVLALQGQPWAADNALLLGPSSTRECISTLADFDAAIARTAGRPVAAWDLAADDAAIPEFAGILDALPDHFSGVVALTVSPTELARLNPDRIEKQARRGYQELGWVSAARDAELRAVGVDVPTPTGVYALDTAPFWIARATLPLQRVVHGPAVFDWHRMAQKVPLANLKNSRQAIRAKLSRYDEAAPGALAALDRLLTAFAARADRVTFLLVEQTELPDLFDDLLGPERHAAYQRDIRALAERRADARYVDLNGVLVPDDFADLVHLGRPGGQQRYTAALGAEVGRAIADLH